MVLNTNNNLIDQNIIDSIARGEKSKNSMIDKSYTKLLESDGIIYYIKNMFLETLKTTKR